MNVIKNIKKKLIHLLGGVLIEETKSMKIAVETVYPITTKVSRCITYQEIKMNGLDISESFAKKSIANEMAEKLYCENLIEFAIANDAIGEVITGALSVLTK